MGGYDPMQLSNAEERRQARMAGLRELSYRLSQTAAKLSGDPARMQLAQQQEAQRIAARQDQFKKRQIVEGPNGLKYYVNPDGSYERVFPGLEKESTTASAERFGIVDITTGKRAGGGSILKSEAETWKQSNQDPNLILVPLAANATKDQKEQYYQVVGPLNNRLRISTMDDYFKGMESGLYPAGSTVVNIPTGTEAPKSQVENIELFSAENKPYAERWQSTSTLHSSLQGYADNLAKSDEAALTGVGATVKYVDGLIQNTKGFLKLASDDTQNFYNNAKAENTYKTIEKQDFTKRLEEISELYGVSESKVRDLAYLFAAARGQTGRGLSDKDYENAIQIVSGGVGKKGKIAVIQDVYNRLGVEISGAVENQINLLNDPNQRGLYNEPQQRYFDIQTGQLKSLQSATPFKPFVNPLTQTPPLTTGGISVDERLNNPIYQ
jgi:hypothetical protein